MNIEPIGKRVVIKRKESEEKTDSGLYIPDTAKEKTHEGEIVAVGTAEDMPLKVGNRVLFDTYAGTDIEIDSQKYVIMKVKEVLAIIR